MVYQTSPDRRWWTRFLKPEFQHVQLWRPIRYGPLVSDQFWLLIDPGMECVVTETVFRPDAPWITTPGMTVQRVVASCMEKRVRNWFFFGPVTCVEIAKAHLGLSSLWIRTPHQLHQHIAKRQGVLISR